MPHIVIHGSSDGKPSYHQVEALDEAVRLVERLRNEQQVTDARIFTMQEVKVTFKAYYQVEVGDSGSEAQAPAASASPAAPAPAALVPVQAPSPSPASSSASEPAAPASPPAAPASSPAPVPAAAASPAGAPKGEPAGANGSGGRFGLFGKA